jgi:hypothetical protein
MAFAELTVTRRYHGIAAWVAELSDDAEPLADGALTAHVQPAVAFLSARGGGMMVLPLDERD